MPLTEDKLDIYYYYYSESPSTYLCFFLQGYLCFPRSKSARVVQVLTVGTPSSSNLMHVSINFWDFNSRRDSPSSFEQPLDSRR